MADLGSGKRELFCEMFLSDPETGKRGRVLVLKAVPKTRRVGGVTLSPRWQSDSVLLEEDQSD